MLMGEMALIGVFMKVFSMSAFVMALAFGAGATASTPSVQVEVSAEREFQGPVVPMSHRNVMAFHANRVMSNFPANNRVLFASALTDGVDECDKADEISDYFVLDIRKKEDHCAGHIFSAVNIPMADVFRNENLRRLPMNRPILVVCYTGHTASQTIGMLNLMGFDAWALRFGMMSWRPTTSMAIGGPEDKINVPGLGLPLRKCGL